MEGKHLLEGLSNYINGDDQFAVMIDGPWGSGKTYFIKNTVIPSVCGEHKAVYFSVYGYDSLDKLKSELVGKLFISSYGRELGKGDSQFTTEDVVSAVKGVSSAVWDKFSAFKTLAETTEKFIINSRLRSQKLDAAPVLVVDDLERLSRDIHTSDLMGFLLTDIIEPYGYRVIVVGNTKEIRGGEGDEFKRTREKVVSRIFQFSYNSANLKNEFFQNSDNQFLQTNADWLVVLFDEYARRNQEQLNLRTLEFILSTFVVMDKKLDQYWNVKMETEKYSNQIRRSAFTNLFVIATEYREGRLTRESLVEINRLINTRSFFFMHMKDDEEISTAEKITIRYHDDTNLSQVIMYSDSVNDAVFSGVFDAKSFIDLWTQLFRPRGKVSNLDQVANFRDMTDEQLELLEQRLLEDARSTDISVNDVLSILDNFLFFDHNGLYFCKEDYLAVILGALDSAAGRELLKNEFAFDVSEFAFRYSVLSKEKDILKQVKTTLESAEEEEQDRKTKRLIVAIFEDNYSAVRDISLSGLRVNIFRTILDSSQLSSKILTVGSKAHLLVRYLNSEYLHVSNFNDFHSGEKQDAAELAQKVEGFINESSNIERIDKFNLRTLLNTLNKILSEFNE